MNVTDNNRLWLDFIAGNRNAFKYLYDAHADMLFDYGCLYTRDADLVKDCVHDLFVDLYRYRSGLNPNVKVRAYLLASLRRKLVAVKRKQPTYAAIESLDEQITPDHAPDIESQIISVEKDQAVLNLLRTALAKLPARQREALYLKFTMELPYVEIADLMDISEATCRTLVYRAIKKLRGNMENQPFLTFFVFFLKNSL